MMIFVLYLLMVYFNPRPREEGDNTNENKKRYQQHFNPRPREEGD